MHALWEQNNTLGDLRVAVNCSLDFGKGREVWSLWWSGHWPKGAENAWEGWSGEAASPVSKQAAAGDVNGF